MFIKGQRVKVRADLEPSLLRQDYDSDIYFVESMDETIGESGTVVDIDQQAVYVRFDNDDLNRNLWAYNPLWLLPYANEVDIMEED